MRLVFLMSVGSFLILTGCEADYFPTFDYYPHHEVETTPSDMMLSGSGSFGGVNASKPVVIPGSGSATNPAGTAPSQPSGLP